VADTIHTTLCRRLWQRHIILPQLYVLSSRNVFFEFMIALETALAILTTAVEFPVALAVMHDGLPIVQFGGHGIVFHAAAHVDDSFFSRDLELAVFAARHRRR